MAASTVLREVDRPAGVVGHVLDVLAGWGEPFVSSSGEGLAHAVALRRVELREQLRPLLLDRECLSHDGLPSSSYQSTGFPENGL